MNCPKCGSQHVVGMGGVMWCVSCKHASDTSSVPPNDPGLDPILIPCPACSKQVSTHADCCPSCGEPVRALVVRKLQAEIQAEKNKEASNHLRNVLALVTLAFFICFWIWHLLNGKPDH